MIAQGARPDCISNLDSRKIDRQTVTDEEKYDG